MLEFTNKKFLIEPIVDQVNQLWFEKRLNLNTPTGSFFGDRWETLSEFKNTPLGNLLDSIGPIGEARLLKLSSAETYTAHADPDDRYHLAIITNPHSYIIDFDNQKLYHLPVDGKLWRMDTSRIHVAANFGGRDRIHLNIRILLPKFDESKPFIRIKFDGGDFDWKQESYIEIMPTLNRLIKAGYISGFDRVTDKELLLNILDKSLLIPVIQSLTDKGFTVTVS